MLPNHKFATVFTVVINYFPWITDHLEMPTTAHTVMKFSTYETLWLIITSSLHHHTFFLHDLHYSHSIYTYACQLVFSCQSLKFGILCTSLPYLLHNQATTCSIPSSKHNISWSIQIMKHAIYIVIPTSYYFLPTKFKSSPQLSLP